MIPQRFATEYPARCMQLFELMEPAARKHELIGSFSLIVATSVFLIPYERMKARHPLYLPDQDAHIDNRLRAIERQSFLKSEIWNGELPGPWWFSRIMNDLNQTSCWEDEKKQHPMAGKADNSIEKRTTNDVLRVIRNALAHGNVVYLDENGFETKGARVQHLGFIARYEENEEETAKAKTFRLVVATEESFLHFVKSWARWLAKFSFEVEFLDAAE